MTRLSAAVVGCGHIARSLYLRELAEDERVKLVAVCDVAADVARKAAAEFGGPDWFDDADAMLTEVRPDLVVVSTTPRSHAEIVGKALAAGANVYVEKPLSGTLAEGRALVDAARAAGLVLAVAPDVILRPEVRALARELQAGSIGKPHSIFGRYGISCRPESVVRAPWYYLDEGGVIVDLASYLVTALVDLLGPARSVSALGSTTFPRLIGPDGEFEVSAADTATLLIALGNYGQAALQCSFYYGGGAGALRFEILGTEGALQLEGRHWASCKATLVKDTAHGLERRPISPEGKDESGLAHVVAAIQNGGPQRLRPELGLHVLDILHAAGVSAETGAAVGVQTPL